MAADPSLPGREVPVEDLSDYLPKVLDDLNRHIPLVLTLRGMPVGAMISIADYPSLLETLDVLRDEAALGDIMTAGREDEWYTLDDVRAAMKPRRRAAVLGD